MHILVLNSGSSSLKIKLFHLNPTGPKEMLSAIADAISLPNSKITIKSKETTNKIELPLNDHESALHSILEHISSSPFNIDLNEINFIGHRIVHGGEFFKNPVELTPEILEKIESISHLAPLHNPANLKGIKACLTQIPQARNFGVFDTSFHQTMPEKAFLYAIPYHIYEQFQIRRYGFHGINHKFVSQEATNYLKLHNLPHQNQISCHLGNGCSVAAIKDGKSIDTSMGFTPLEGLIMGTRSGDIDPAVTLELCKVLNKTPEEIEKMLNSMSGLKGISGESSDMRILIENSKNGDLKAILAIEMFCYRLAKYIGSFIAALNDLDALIFTGGIGENSAFIRKKVTEYFKYLNLKINSEKNSSNSIQITEQESKTQILIIPANEEFQITKEIISLF